MGGPPLALRDRMARPLRIHVPGVACHVMSRGNNKQEIFSQDADYTRFLELLPRLCDRFRITCLAYCLMWNHTHLLLRPLDKPISSLMQQLNSTYCQWFNRRHERVGHVLQGRFKGRLVEDDASLVRVLRYILRNPVAARYVDDPAAWRWSSYRAIAGLEAAPDWLQVEETWQMLEDGSGVPRTVLGRGEPRVLGPIRNATGIISARATASARRRALCCCACCVPAIRVYLAGNRNASQSPYLHDLELGAARERRRISPVPSSGYTRAPLLTKL